jgi:hypothetical protein
MFKEVQCGQTSDSAIYILVMPGGFDEDGHVNELGVTSLASTGTSGGIDMM